MKKRKYLRVIVTIAIFGPLYLMGNAIAKEASIRPNIVLIMADDLGFECIGANGGSSYKTPVLDGLAEKGIRFEHCYSQPLCTPSRVQIMTGMYNVRNYTNFGAFSNCNIIGSRERIYPIRVIRNKSFTLTYNPNHKGQTSNTTLDTALDNLEKDPYELKNEINNPEYRTVAEELKKQLHAKLMKLGDADPITTEKSLVKASKEK